MFNKRKNPRLPDYEYSQPGAYFVTVCTKEKACILSTIVGGDAYIAPTTPPVGGDAHIAPTTPPVEGDAYIAPYPRLTKIGQICEKYLRTIPGIGSYVIMPNHIHMILHISGESPLQGPMWASAPTQTNLSSLVRSWKILVTKELGKSIWQRSFYDHIIRDEADYFKKVQYIEENPKKWYFDDYYV